MTDLFLKCLFVSFHPDKMSQANQLKKSAEQSLKGELLPELKVLHYSINPVNSVKVESPDSSSPEGDGEDVTSNDTIPVSNETEAELTVNETGPGYFEWKDTYGGNITQDLKEAPKIMGNRSPNESNKLFGNGYHDVDDMSGNPISVERNYSVSTPGKEKLKIFRFFNNFLKNCARCTPNFTRLHGGSNSVLRSVQRTPLFKKKSKTDDNTTFSKMLKRFERMLTKSRTSSQSDFQRMRKLLYDLGRLARVQYSSKKAINDALLLNATNGINSRVSAIEKRMYVAGGQEVLKNITEVLIKIMNKIKNSSDAQNTTVQEITRVPGGPKKSSRSKHQHLEITDMMKRIKHLESVFQTHFKNEKLRNCKVASSVLDQMTLTSGFVVLKRTFLGTVKDMGQCVKKCCRDKLCDLAVSKSGECYGIDCKHQKCLLSPVAKLSTESSVALLTKRISANIAFTGLRTGASSTDKCEVQLHIIADSALGQGGLKGNSTVLKHVTDAWSCGMECCKVGTCNVAMIQDGVCYVISCFADGPCFEFKYSPGLKTSLAFVRRTSVSIIKPSLSLKKIKETSTASSSHFNVYPRTPVISSVILTNSLTTTSLYSPTHSTLTALDSQYSYNQNKPLQSLSNTNNLHLNLPNPEFPTNSSNTCFQTFHVANVTLRAGFLAGNFKFQGALPTPSACADYCCQTEDCNVALLLQNMCFLVTCDNSKLCQNEPLLSNEFTSSLVYVVRSPLEADMVKDELVPTIKRKLVNISQKSKIDQTSNLKASNSISNITKAQNDCFVGFIAANAKLLHGFESGKIIVLGKLKRGLNECISKCCNQNRCNASLSIGEQCFLVECYSKESCQIVQSDSDVDSSIAILMRNIDNRSLSYLSPRQQLTSAALQIHSSYDQHNISPSKSGVNNTLKTSHALMNGKESLEQHSLTSTIFPSFINAAMVITSSAIPTRRITIESIQNLYRSLDRKPKVSEPVLTITPSTVSGAEKDVSISVSVRTPTSKTVEEENYFLNNNNMQSSLRTSSSDTREQRIPHSDISDPRLMRKTQQLLDILSHANKSLNNVNGSYDKIRHASQEIKDQNVYKVTEHFGHPVGLAKNVSTKTRETVGKDSLTSRVSEMENKNEKKLEEPNINTFKVDELASKVRNLFVEQEELRTSVPLLREIVNKIQQNLDNGSRLAKTKKNENEGNKSNMGTINVKNSSMLQPLKTSVARTLFQGNPLPSQGATPTPKLVRSPTVLVTSPSLVASHGVRFTSRRVQTTSIKPALSTERVSMNKVDKPNLDERIVLVLKSAGVLPLKSGKGQSSVDGLTGNARELRKTYSREKFIQERSRHSSIASPSQPLVHFLEEQVRQRTTQLEEAEQLRKFTKPRKYLTYSWRLHGLADKQHALNEHVKKLEREIQQLKSLKSAESIKNKLSMKKVVSGSALSVMKSVENVQILKPTGEGNAETISKLDKAYILRQLQSIVRSELFYRSQLVSPASTKVHSTNIKSLSISRNAKKHKHVLKQNLSRLYIHAVNELQKSLDTSGKAAKESGDDNLMWESVKKNTIDSKKHNMGAMLDSTNSKKPEFLDITLKKSKHEKIREGVSISKKADKSLASSLSTKAELSPFAIRNRLSQAKENELGIKKKMREVVNASGHLLAQTKLKESSVSVIQKFKQPKLKAVKESAVNPVLDVYSSKMSKNSTCQHSRVQFDVTLRGGIARDGVKDEGTVLDINDCIERCCKHTSCNVAFMLKDNCFLLPCKEKANVCQVVKLSIKSLNTKLAFVIRGNKTNLDLKMFDDIVNTLGLFSNTKSKSGLSPVSKGKLPIQANSVKTDEIGQVASDKRQELSPSSFFSSYNSTLHALVDRKDFLTSQINPVDRGLAPKTHHSNVHVPNKPITAAEESEVNRPFLYTSPVKAKVCPYGDVEYNTTVKGGLVSVDYKYAGKATNINSCVQLCCKSDTCNVAFMFSSECFLLACKGENKCEGIPATSPEVNPTIVRLLKTDSDRNVHKPTEPIRKFVNRLLPPNKGILRSLKKAINYKSLKQPSVDGCMKSDPLFNVIPGGGMKVGNFKDFRKVKSLGECINLCCGWRNCSMAFMVLDGCFGVACMNHCRVVPSGDLSLQSKVVYVKRHQEVLHWLNTQPSSRSVVPNIKNIAVEKNENSLNLMKNLPARYAISKSKTQKNAKFTTARNDSLISSDTQNYVNLKNVSSEKPSDTEQPDVMKNSWKNSKALNEGEPDKVSTRTSSHGQRPKTLEKSLNAKQDKNSEAKKLSLPVIDSNESTISKDKRGDGIRPQINVKAAVEPRLSGASDDKEVCVPGEVEHDVTLAGGIRAGSYTEQGEVLNMQECVHWCCKDRKCDVAMLIKGICYSVSCYERQDCDSVPVRRIQYHPSLVHVSRVKRNIDHDSRSRDRDVSLPKIVEGYSGFTGRNRASLKHETVDEENPNSAIEDELVDLLTEQSSRDSARTPIEKG